MPHSPEKIDIVVKAEPYFIQQGNLVLLGVDPYVCVRENYIARFGDKNGHPKMMCTRELLKEES